MLKDVGEQNGNNAMYQLWQQNNHPIMLEAGWIDQKLSYIHNNPVKEGWTNEPEEYYYSSARNYANLMSPLKITSIYDGNTI